MQIWSIILEENGDERESSKVQVAAEEGMDLSTTQRRPADGVIDIQKTRVAKSVFSIRSLVELEDNNTSQNIGDTECQQLGKL